MPPILDHSAWAVRPETVAAIKQIVSGDLPRADVQRLLAAPEAAEARIRISGPVDPEDIPRVGSVALLSLSGLIQPNPSLLSYLLYGASTGLNQFRAELRAAIDDDSIEAILLQIDSPGGSCALVQETAAEIRAAAQAKPIVAVANTLAASAAYWLGSQATELVVTPSGYVGSIGVYMLHTDLSGALEQEGVAMTYVYAAPFKVEGNPYEPLSDEARADWQADVDAIYDVFVNDVAAGRGTTPDAVRSNFGEGRVLRAPDALAAGMVDRVETFEAALAGVRASVDQDTGSRASALRRADTVAPVVNVYLDGKNIAELAAKAEPADEPAGEPPAEPEATENPADGEQPPAEPDPVAQPERVSAADDFDVLAA